MEVCAACGKCGKLASSRNLHDWSMMFSLRAVVVLLAAALACLVVSVLTFLEVGSWPGALLAGLTAGGGVAVGLPALLGGPDQDS